MEPNYANATYEDLFGPPPRPAPGQSHYDPSFVARKTDYNSQKARFIGAVPVGSSVDNMLRAESSAALANCAHFMVGQVVFYVYNEGGSKSVAPKRVVGVALPETPVKFRYHSYTTFRDNNGVFISEYHQDSVDFGFPIFDPPGLHPHSNDETKAKNEALLKEWEESREAAIDAGLAEI